MNDMYEWKEENISKCHIWGTNKCVSMTSTHACRAVFLYNSKKKVLNIVIMENELFVHLADQSEQWVSQDIKKILYHTPIAKTQ